MSGSSPVGDFFTKEDLGQNAACLKCKKLIPMKGGNTTGLISHLRKHDEDFKKFDKARDAKEEERKKNAAKKRIM